MAAKRQKPALTGGPPAGSSGRVVAAPVPDVSPVDERRAAQVRRLTSRLRRAEGQLRAVTGMVVEDRPCEEIAQQLSAVRAALDKAYFELMACAMTAAVTSPDPAVEAELDQLKDVLVRYA